MDTRVSRRNFLQVIIAVGAGGGLLGCNGSGGTDPESFGDVSAGNISDLSVGTLRAVSGAPAFVGRDANGVYAMTSTCTHAGCDMISAGSITAQGVTCQCHGSKFDKNGNVTAGPASKALAHFAASLSATGDITVHGGSEVSAAHCRSVARDPRSIDTLHNASWGPAPPYLMQSRLVLAHRELSPFRGSLRFI